MNISEQIEAYAQRKIDFTKDVILVADINSNMIPYIAEWNITDISQPTQENLDQQITPYVAPLTKDQINANILFQISKLETSQARPLREMLVCPNDEAKQKLQTIDNEIINLRSQLIK
jgi:hypothetical protein